jgi:hypothetical protein
MNAAIQKTLVLKGHGFSFSRAAKGARISWASAPEGRFGIAPKPSLGG